jgi:hypothetical protein
VATQADLDAEHLRLLSIFHYVLAGVQALFASFPILHFLFGVAMVFLPKQLGARSNAPAALVGSALMLFTGTWMMIGWTIAICTAVAGRSLSQRKRYLFCLVMAGVMAATCMPYGTVLGAFTIIILLRPSVKEAFGVASP